MEAGILIVDDLAFMRQVIRDSLVEAGFRIIGEAENGAEGVRLYQRLKPDAVLLDISMPVMNGIEAMQRILRLDPQASVVMCSALGEQSMIIKAIQLGARDFVVKPFRPERLISATRKALEA
ncbi:MAG: response regulator [Spirochaetales bacterium]|nr:response regulator [Spirochaetales bacterium]MCF7937140.1 response regulator [Spirochaetales bacterium]